VGETHVKRVEKGGKGEQFRLRGWAGIRKGLCGEGKMTYEKKKKRRIPAGEGYWGESKTGKEKGGIRKSTRKEKPKIRKTFSRSW